MIDPLNALAFAVQANAGVYAILIGSGVSRPAKIPTGWEITADLIRKLASLSGEDCGPDPESWFTTKTGNPPDYSALLDSLGKTGPERQQLIRGYIEPTPAERDEGAKQPTVAHRAIADLAASGFIKVIITTNFDRLIETALADVGVTPTVLSTADQIVGALPLIHTQCSVIKLHGDYLDSRIRNTARELATYEPQFDALLDRVLDEFGLIICGWSSDWDEALRGAITRAPARRFTTYWAVRGDPSDAATALMKHRAAQVIRITDADSFFASLLQQVQSLEQYSRPHPLSTEAAVASLKKFLSEPKFRIQLSDLIDAEVDRVAQATSIEKLPVANVPEPTNVSLMARVRTIEAANETLMAMGVVGGYWAEPEHYVVWSRALARLASRPARNGFRILNDLGRYRGTLLLYALGLSAVDSRRFGLLGALFRAPVERDGREELPAIQLLPPFCLFEGDAALAARFLDGLEKRLAPMNDWLHQRLRPLVARQIPGNEKYTFVFDSLEVLMALSYGYYAKRTADWYWAPPGAYGYRRDNAQRIIDEIENSLKSGDASPYVASRIFGDSAAECQRQLELFKEFKNKISMGWH